MPGLMVVDVVCLICLLVFAIRGYRKGLLIAVFSLLAIILGTLGALKLSGSVSAVLFDGGSKGGRWAPLLSYLLVFALIVWLVRTGASMLQRSFEAVSLGWINQLSGALLYMLLIGFVLSCLFWLLHRMGLIPNETMQQSMLYPFIEPLAPRTFALLGNVFPFAQHVFEDLAGFFDTVNQNIPEHVGVDR